MSDPDFEGWPPAVGSFVAVTEAEGKEEVEKLFEEGAIRAWNLGKVKRFWVEDAEEESEKVGMVELVMYGTSDANTLTGKYGPARCDSNGAWHFSVHGSERRARKSIYYI